MGTTHRVRRSRACDFKRSRPEHLTQSAMERVVSTAIGNVRPVRTSNLAKLGASVADLPPKLRRSASPATCASTSMLPLPDTDSGPAGSLEIQKPLAVFSWSHPCLFLQRDIGRCGRSRPPAPCTCAPLRRPGTVNNGSGRLSMPRPPIRPLVRRYSHTFVLSCGLHGFPCDRRTWPKLLEHAFVADPVELDTRPCPRVSHPGPGRRSTSAHPSRRVSRPLYRPALSSALDPRRTRVTSPGLPWACALRVSLS